MDEAYEKLLNKVKKYNSQPNEKLLREAYNAAKEAHNSQHRASGEPYFVHPLEVANILADLEMDCESIAAGLLHDVVEDTPHSLEEIRQKFGDGVALLVEGVTKLEKIPYTSREQQQVENFYERCFWPWPAISV